MPPQRTIRKSRNTSLSSQRVAGRSRYTRTTGDLLVGGTNYADTLADGFGAGIDPSGTPPVWWLGLDSGGGAYPIGPHGPYAHGPAQAVVTRATSLITGPLTAAPFRVQELGFGGQPLTRPRWITDPMLMRPDQRFVDDVYPAALKVGRGAFFSDWVRSAIFWGCGAFLCQEDAMGQPIAGTLKLINPQLLYCERHGEDNSLRWVIGADGAQDLDKVIFDRDGYVTLGPVTYRLVALRNPHSPVDNDGHSQGVFEMNPGCFRLGAQVSTFESGTFRSGIPAGYLKVDQSMNSMTQEQAEELKAKWMASHGGDRRSIAVLNAFTSFVPINLSPVDAALGEVKRLNIGDIAFAFGLDPLTLGITLGNSAAYTNLRDAWTNHKDFGLAPWISAVQDTLTALLPGTQGVVVDLDKFANPAPQDRFNGYKVAIDSGWLLPEEVRVMEGLPPLTPEQMPPPPPPPTTQSVPLPPIEAPAPTPVAEPPVTRARPAALR